MAISTRDLSELPDPTVLEALTRSLAMLDAIMSPDWKYRYFLYNPVWAAPLNERMASLDNGSGDRYFLVFSSAGAFLKGFDHESYMTPWAFDPLKVWDGVLDEVPEEFGVYLHEPTFDMASTTFCMWRRSQDSEWTRGPVKLSEDKKDPDGSENLLWMLSGNPATYVEFALEYYEKVIPIEAVEHVYALRPLTVKVLANLNPDLVWEEAVISAEEILYPLA